ncbi:hypothetical protein C6558_03420 [Ensifer sp. NM-2]|nr:hypothetical protein C6558_03420 [Ensifer sp. NM-2]
MHDPSRIYFQRRGRYVGLRKREPPHPIISVLCEKFGLTALQACEACKLAQQYRTNRKAFG